MKQKTLKILGLSLLLLLVFSLSACKLLCAHENSEWTLTREATTELEGLRELICSDCGEVVKREELPLRELTLEEITEKLSKSVFKVYSYAYDGQTVISQGSGFFIDGEGSFLTNAHVINGAYFVKIVLHDGKSVAVDKIYKFDYTESDYAICHANVSDSEYVSFIEEASVGESVFALGFPGDAPAIRVSVGKITSTNTVADGVHYYANNAEIASGSSGGLLVNAQGKALGISSCLFENMTYGAIRYKDIKPAVTEEYTEFKSPLEQFHSVTLVELSESNVNEYFEIVSSARHSGVGTTLDFAILLRIKDKYIAGGACFPEPPIKMTLRLTVSYSYINLSGKNEKRIVTRELPLELMILTPLIRGIDYSTSVSASISSISAVEAEYKIEIVEPHGLIEVYDIDAAHIN